MSEEIQRVAVWPPLLRILHLMMSATVLILLLTGLLLSSGMILNEQLYQHLLQVWHLPSGHVLAFVLLVRIGLLLINSGVSGWRALIPDKLDAIINTATFYLSLGRMNLPIYFAHNPLWKPVYLVMFLLLSLQVFFGFLLESPWLRSVAHLDSLQTLNLHRQLFSPLLVMVIAHVITALLHDWKSPSAELSAIVNGHKFFTVERKDVSAEMPVKVDLSSLTNSSTKSGKWPVDP